ncbi:hypothetical protein [Gordonia spumicola]|uniref:hypothetical protein n=1 Tax=Gordonia spumicola TaxID=589161 RepID=UPI00137B097C|nr:hypothetical protein [Gordonia spumicola]
MEHNGAARRAGRTSASDEPISPSVATAIEATIADLRTLRDEELPVPVDVLGRIDRTLADLARP